MKVKIDDVIYDAQEEPIMIILSKADKNNIANMPSDCSKYCSFPDDWNESDIEEFMEIDES